MKQVSQKVQELLAETSSIASERFNNIRTVKSFTQEDKEIQNYFNKVSDVFQLSKQQAIVQASFMAGSFFFVFSNI